MAAETQVQPLNLRPPANLTKPWSSADIQMHCVAGPGLESKNPKTNDPDTRGTGTLANRKDQEPA